MVRYLTTNGISGIYDLVDPFTLRYRRVNRTFYELIKFELNRIGLSIRAPLLFFALRPGVFAPLREVFFLRASLTIGQPGANDYAY
jgi:hypothetical protein